MQMTSTSPPNSTASKMHHQALSSYLKTTKRKTKSGAASEDQALPFHLPPTCRAWDTLLLAMAKGSWKAFCSVFSVPTLNALLFGALSSVY